MNHDQLAAELEATGDYRILRRFRPRSRYSEPDGTERRGVMLDFETTGTDTLTDEVTEVGMVPFTFSASGRLVDVGPALSQFNEPSRPMPPEVTALTGIDADTVRGHRLDIGAMVALAETADIIVAHNADFDRRFAERLSPFFTSKRWACSMTQVPWKEEGFDGFRLGYLATACGFFFHGHRATDDCLATLEVLSHPLPKSGETALARMMREAETPSMRIVAHESAFSAKDWLKARGYRWSNGSNGPKAWWREVAIEAVDEEVRAVKQHAGGQPSVIIVESHKRFSTLFAW